MVKDLGKKEVDRDRILSKKGEVGDILVPSSIFQDRDVSPFEALVKYLRDNEKLRFREISILLRRDERNIWTVYRRAKKKKNEE